MCGLRAQRETVRRRLKYFQLYTHTQPPSPRENNTCHNKLSREYDVLCYIPRRSDWVVEYFRKLFRFLCCACRKSERIAVARVSVAQNLGTKNKRNPHDD